MTPPPGWDAEIALPAAVDMNDDPDVVEVAIDARESDVHLAGGLQAAVWTYNGMLPGPLLRVRAGNRLIVHFTNHLPEETTIHWHGLRVPADMDGNPMAQPATPPGGSFTYDFVVPDAGTYWYHAHYHSNAQVGRGLYGPLIVDPPGGAPDPDLGLEVPLVLDDVLLNDDGTLAPADAGGTLGDYFGREGNVLLVNGRATPTLLARPGAPLRLRIINAANARYYQLGLEGHTFTQVGSDGGLMASPVTTDTLLVVPGSRAEAVLVPHGEPGDVLTVRWIPFDRGYCSACRPPEDVLRIQLAEAPVRSPSVPAHLRDITPIDTTHAAQRTIELTEGAMDGNATLGIDGHPFGEGVSFKAMVGETEVWTFVNTTLADHPLHLHGFSFQVLSSGDVAPPVLAWKDTVNVPAKKTARFAVTFDDRPGMWMFHCHILDHAEIGMMGTLEVMP